MRAQIPSLVVAVLAILLLSAENQSALRAQDVPAPRDAGPFPDNQQFQPPVTPANPPPVTPTSPFSPSGPLSAPVESTPVAPAPFGAYPAPSFGVSPAPGCGTCPTPGCGVCPAPAPALCPAPTCGCPVQFIAGIDATMFYATVHRMDASTSIANQPGDPTTSIDTSEDRVYDRFTYSPRIYLGVQEDGWALIGRFWYLSDSTNSQSTGSAINASMTDDQLKAYTADIELMRDFWIGGSKVGLFLGARYGSFSAGQSINSVSSDLSSPALPSSAANAMTNFSFNGIGLTTGFQGRTPLVPGSSLSLLWGGRGSVLWGEDERQVLVGALIDDPSGTAATSNGGDETNRAIAYILEAQLGLEWRHELRWVPMAAYFRVAFEYQYWNLGDGSLSKTVSTASSLPAPPAPSLASASIGHVDADFIGLIVGAGLNW
jgi:hypothetical protein